MSITIPLVPSVPHYRFNTSIDSAPYLIDARWNARDSAWYLDFYEDDETPIVRGIKVVLGAYLGRWVQHSLFTEGVFVVTDTSGAGVEAALDDIGRRIVLQRYTLAEVTLHTLELAALANA